MTAGPLVAAVGLLLFGQVEAGSTYVGDVLPAVLVFGLGLTITVAPLTSAVLAAAEDRHLGVASGTNNAVARIGGLIAIAVLPALAGIDAGAEETLASGFSTAMVISAVVCAAGGVIAFLTVRSGERVRTVAQATIVHPCGEPCLAEQSEAA